MSSANKVLSCLAITAFFLLFTAISFAQSAIPPYIYYQGKLVDQATGAPINDSKSITFSLYDSETGEPAIYYQIREVAINEGVFSVYLGKGEGYYDGNQVADGIPAEVFTDHSARYLGIKLEDSQTEMTPRQPIASVAYAYKTEKSSKADYASKAGEAENLMGQVSVSPSGNVGIGTANPGGLLDVGGGNLVVDQNTGNVGIGTKSPGFKLHIEDGSIYINNPSNGLFLQGETTLYGVFAASGTDFARFGPSASDEGVIVNSSGNIGIGTTSPGAKLHVQQGNDNVWIGNILSANEPGIEMEDGGQGKVSVHAWGPDLRIRVGGTDRVSIKGSGNVGIGTTSPSCKLHVNGTAYATGAAGALSDKRHKTNINDLSFYALEVVNALRPVTFEWKEPLDSGMEGTQLGFIAQEVEEVLPEAVLTQDNEEQTKGLKYNALIPLLTKAIQELEAQNKALKAENNSLRYEIDQIKEVIGLKRRKGDVVN